MERPAIADYPPGSLLPTRTIDDFELVWMLRGRAVVVTDDGDIPLPTHRLVLLPPAVPHGIRWDPRRASRHGYVHFGPSHFRRTSTPSEIVHRPMTDDDPLAGLCAHLLRVGQLDEWRQPAEETLSFLLEVLLTHPLPADREEPKLPAAVAAAVDVLRREWSELPLRRITVDELASAAAVSRGYLARACTRTFGTSPATLLDRLRLARAETLLSRTDLSAEAIARACGFADVSHFSHRFSAVHGLSPRTYRSAGATAPTVLDEPGVRRLARLVWE